VEEFLCLLKLSLSLSRNGGEDESGGGSFRNGDIGERGGKEGEERG